mmetsp:Transcript_18125/g.37130  ORF Transcript_18125/g.37130 Transcript_18125/m.37130 type:complete len:228 (+) Transcript_18125:1177-1860(+)
MERRPPRRALTDTSYGLGAAVTPTTIASPRSFSFVSSSAFAFSNIPPPTGSLSLRLLPPPPPGEPPFPFPFPPPPVNRSMGFKNIPPPTEANTTAPAAKTPHNDDDDDDNDSRGGPPEKVGASHPGIERRAAPTAKAGTGTGERKTSVWRLRRESGIWMPFPWKRVQGRRRGCPDGEANGSRPWILPRRQRHRPTTRRMDRRPSPRREGRSTSGIDVAPPTSPSKRP